MSSGCTGSQPTISAALWTPPGPNGGTSQFEFCYASFNFSFTAPDCIDNAGHSDCQPTSGSASYLQSLVLPNGTAWTFEYDNFGDLSSITLPTGGTISYTWNYTPSVCGGMEYIQNGVNTWLWPYTLGITSRTANANDGTGLHTWNYSSAISSPSYQTIVTDPALNDTVHTETMLALTCSVYETELDQYSGSHTSGTLLKKVATTYNYTSGPNYLPSDIAINVVPATITTTDELSGQVSQVKKTYDSGIAIGNGYNAIYGDVLTKSDYDYGTGAPGSLLRTTTNTYMALSGPNASSYLANNLLDLPYTVQLTNGSAQLAYTTYGYDETGLQTSNVTEQKVAGESYPGNQTSVHRWLSGSTVSQTPCNVSVSNGYLVSNNVFYDTGEVQLTKDPCGYPTTYQYSSTYYGAFPTTVTNPLNQSTNFLYDFNTGSVTSIQDPNLQTTTQTYDVMNRLTKVSYPDGGLTSYCYTDGVPAACASGNAGNWPFAVVVKKAITSSTNEFSTAIMDGLGRLSQTQLNSDPSGTTYTETTYDPLGRKSQVYNPTRCSSITTNCNNETTWGVIRYTYDPLNRVTLVTEQDGSVVKTTYDQINSNSTGVCSTVTDEAGNSRQSCVDGLGRMTGVWEDPGSSPHLNYETDYAYDALNNLLSVTQKGSSPTNERVRTFQYDSLSHLTQAANPESGTIIYAYDADGNVITRTAPLANQTQSAQVIATYVYDKLNRVINKSYTDPYTPLVQYGYDAVALSGCTIAPPSDTDTFPVGRRTSMCDGSEGTSWIHDKMGRVTEERRSIGLASVNHYIDYTFNLDGSLKVLQTPPMKQLNYTYNGAARPTQLVDSTDNINFALGATYAPPGELAGATLGSASGFTGFTVTNYYNDRLQPILLSATNSATGATVFSDCFDFHLGVAITPNQTPPCSVLSDHPKPATDYHLKTGQRE